MFDTLEHKFGTLEHKFETLEHKFDSLEHRFLQAKRTFIQYKSKISCGLTILADPLSVVFNMVDSVVTYFIYHLR